MPYLFLAVAALVGLYGLYRFFLAASPTQIKAMGFSLLALTLSAALLVLALTGRLPAALAVLTALLPFAVTWWEAARKRRRNTNGESPQPRESGSTMSRAEALDTLGLEGDPTAEDIDDAYKRLIKKVHPDADGSNGLTTRLNAARDRLLSETPRAKE